MTKGDELAYLQTQLLLRPGIVALDDLIPLPDNPKLHSKQYLRNVVKKYGYRSRIIVNETTMHILSGNGRVDDLTTAKIAGIEIPKGVAVGHDGKWYIAVDFTDVSVEDEIPLAIVYNRTEELGGWDQALLAKVLPKVNDDKVDTLGFERELISALKAWNIEEAEDDESLNEKINAAVASPDSEKIVEQEHKKGRVELTVLRYVVRLDVANTFRKALRLAMKKAETEDISEALGLIVNNYIELKEA